MIEKDPWGNVKINFEKLKMKNSKFGIYIILAIVLFGWLLTGIYIVDADEKAVIKRFGKIVKEVGPGPHYHLPFPFETVDRAKITKVHRLEIGYRSDRFDRARVVAKESLMLTGDENIVSIDFIVQYRIRDLKDYLYNIVNVEKAIKDVAEATIREVAGKEKIDDILTVGKGRIQAEVMKSLQEILDNYKSGVYIVAVQLQDISPPEEVDAAFKDVASAREDRNRFINEAESYRNEIIPKARAKAASMIYQAEAYSSEQVEKAKGDSTKFLQILEEYKNAPNVTKKRLYLENVGNFLSKSKNYIFDSNIDKISPFIGLDSINKEGVKE